MLLTADSNSINCLLIYLGNLLTRVMLLRNAIYLNKLIIYIKTNKTMNIY